MSKLRILCCTRTYLLLLAILLVPGCTLIRAREDQERVAALGRIQGTVRMEPETRAPLIVALLPTTTADATRPEDIEIVDHFVRDGAGSYAFSVVPGDYLLGAFADLNRDGNLDPDEPVDAAIGRAVDVEAGGTVSVDLVIPKGERPERIAGPVDVRAVQARSLRGQAWRSVGQLLVKGEVVDVNEPRFGPATGRLGLWQPLDAVIQVGGGIYFTEPYNPDRVPVLFVHGIGGFPQEFESLMATLDHDRFQAWFYLYPSGLGLEGLGQWGSEAMSELQLRYGFPEFAIVAHSMGGLVSRSLLLSHFSSDNEGEVPLFVTISTPWAGHSGAELGVDHSPVILDSWRDLDPRSDFLRNLFWLDEARTTRRELPEETEVHLLWSYGGPKDNTDGSVSIASQQRSEAQEASVSVTGYDENHDSILESEAVQKKLGELLQERFG